MYLRVHTTSLFGVQTNIIYLLYKGKKENNLFILIILLVKVTRYLIIDVGKDYIGHSPSNITLKIGRVNKIFNRDRMISLFLQYILYH